MSVLVVIQARLGSTRLPGKVLLPLGPDRKPVLQHVVERAQRSGYEVAIAIPESSATDELWGWICGNGPVKCNGWVSSGDENDVLFRYTGALSYRKGDWDIVVRLTADCPCLDPRLIQRAVEAVQGGHDYAGNTVDRCYPRGLDVECFTNELLMRAHQAATLPYDREHVTPWMQRHARNPYALSRTSEDAPGLTNAHRWTLDTLEDYRWLEQAFTAFPDPSPAQLLTLEPHWEPPTPSPLPPL